ncbi:hypothetical protein D049_4908A, partial [Vibrio parahaemolyticus VPTS-2010]
MSQLICSQFVQVGLP